ncbi:hypothetical protein AMECASPLE_004706 [Ameca splendens]|uniref:Uncharacterized protein n=1 Tax=Ameca splendens TaxID=208324 RepID=A0ABV0XN24_9TELE
MSSEYSLFALPMTDFNYSPVIWMSTLALKTDYHFSPNLPDQAVPLSSQLLTPSDVTTAAAYLPASLHYRCSMMR